ncbi:hypothetical protein PQY77_02940 [Candidatus Pelagibacter sp.]|nr:hypothetical protein [Candidatus Pelagibacter sp.]
MKNIILITFVFFLYSCGYTSVYKNLQNQDFKIIITEMRGDKNMNNLIKNEINLYSNKNSVNKFNVEIETNYTKEVLTKDGSGLITNYKLSTNAKFVIFFNGKTKKIVFDETINITNQTDTFEQDVYEKNIKRNFASIIRDKLISEMLTLQHGDGIITVK